MAYRPHLCVDVDWRGATFSFGSADEVWARLAALDGDDEGEPAAAALVGCLCELFVSAVRHWDGVVGDDGQPIECTREAREQIPSGDKVQVAAAYLTRLEELDEKKG